MNLIKKFFDWKKRIEDPLYDFDDWEQVDAWNEVVYDRDDLKITNKKSRQEYVRGCLEQIAEASTEVEKLQIEYNVVTDHLRDMEEIEALPEPQAELIKEYARKIDSLKGKQEGYLKRTVHMDEAKYRALERMEDELAEGYEKLSEAENYQQLIKRDLKKLENEKQAYFFRKSELKRTLEDCKSMAIVCAVAVVVCIVILLVMHYGFKLDTTIGYLATALAGAVGITMIFIRHNDSSKELKQVGNGISKLIRLQNTVKIRYVNNTNLLDYLYVKYGASSAKELGKDYEQFLEERKEREKYEEAVTDLDKCEKDMIFELRKYRIKDPAIWLHQTEAILDKKEMVEIRHKLIIQRQSLRRRMDYNKQVIAAKAQDEIKDLVDKYPKYAKEILDIVAEYEKEYK
ncbi:MAG: hypothetical protein K5888_00895 [Lachnospiraceae bacterium]|nr:hypothetical protein [Lachnospiraceae bacterium]